MASEDIVIITIASIVLLVSIIFLSYYFPKIKKIIREQQDVSHIIKGIVSEIYERLIQQDQKLIDQQVKIDILELKIEQFNKIPSKEIKELKNINDNDLRTNIKELKDLFNTFINFKHNNLKQEKKINNIKLMEKLSPTEIIILKSLMEKPQTSIDIQKIMNKSREHSARLMKKLNELGYIYRDEKKKPYIYFISEEGKEVIK